MQITGRVEGLKISQHNDQRRVEVVLSGLITKEQEQQFVAAFMSAQVKGLMTFTDTVFGKDIMFDLGAEAKKG